MSPTEITKGHTYHITGIGLVEIDEIQEANGEVYLKGYLAGDAVRRVSSAGAAAAVHGGEGAGRHPLEIYADSYAQMARDGDGCVDCRSVEVDIRQNMMRVTRALTATQSAPAPGGWREALEPFAKVADEYDEAEDDDFEVWHDAFMNEILRASFKLGHYRKARDLLSASPAPEPVADAVVPDYDQHYLVAYVSHDAKTIGIDHPTDADWHDVRRAHIALRDRINERLATQDECPFRPKGEPSALAERQPQPQEGGWRDIATAPKDCVEFQAWVINEDGKGWWEPRCWINDDGAFEIWGRVDSDHDGWDVYPHLTATHWIGDPKPPHPAAPLPSQKEGE